jgi:hypothetical protein
METWNFILYIVSCVCTCALAVILRLYGDRIALLDELIIRRYIFNILTSPTHKITFVEEHEFENSKLNNIRFDIGESMFLLYFYNENMIGSFDYNTKKCLMSGMLMGKDSRRYNKVIKTKLEEIYNKHIESLETN